MLIPCDCCKGARQWRGAGRNGTPGSSANLVLLRCCTPGRHSFTISSHSLSISLSLSHRHLALPSARALFTARAHLNSLIPQSCGQRRGRFDPVDPHTSQRVPVELHLDLCVTSPSPHSLSLFTIHYLANLASPLPSPLVRALTTAPANLVLEVDTLRNSPSPTPHPDTLDTPCTYIAQIRGEENGRVSSPPSSVLGPLQTQHRSANTQVRQLASVESPDVTRRRPAAATRLGLAQGPYRQIREPRRRVQRSRPSSPPTRPGVVRPRRPGGE
jgi:hypothetical protein